MSASTPCSSSRARAWTRSSTSCVGSATGPGPIPDPACLGGPALAAQRRALPPRPRRPDPRRRGRGQRGVAVHPRRSVRPRRPPRSRWKPLDPGWPATPSETSQHYPVAGWNLTRPDRARTERTEVDSAIAGDTNSPDGASTSVDLSSSASSSSSSAILPGGTQLSSAETGRHAFFRSLAQIGRQVAGGLTYAHAGGSCTATSSPRTCSWTPKAWSGSRISAWPKGTTKD